MSMTITDYVCGSCAAASISNLGSHRNAFEAVSELFKNTLGTPSASRYVTSDALKFNTMNSHYIFIAGPEAKPGEAGRSHHSKDWVSYGTEFAQYLLDRGLGTVATAGQILNAKYHPTTTCQVWIFQPNQKACERWWSMASQGLVAYNELVKKARFSQAAVINEFVAKNPEIVPFKFVYHYGYHPTMDIPAAQSQGQIITITSVDSDYAHYKNDFGYNVYMTKRTRENPIRDLVPGTYFITQADYTYWTLVPVPAEISLELPKMPKPTLTEPPMASRVTLPPGNGLVKKRRWKHVVDVNGVRKREYSYEMVEGLAGAYSINASKEPVEAPPNEQSPIAEVA